MAYYPPEFVDRIRLIKQLQEERFMPLRVIRRCSTRTPSAPAPSSSSRTGSSSGRSPASATRDQRRRGAPSATTFPPRCSAGSRRSSVLSPNSRGYTPSDVRIIEAISRFRAGGYDEAIGFTVYDTLRYREAIEPLVARRSRSCWSASPGKDGRPTAR